MNNTEKFDLWCIIELFGHQKIAGRCTEQNIAGTNMLRVDVPETPTSPAFSRLFGSAAIYAINPVDESTAKHYAERLQVQPIQSWDVKEIVKKHHEKLLTEAVPGPAPVQMEQDEFGVYSDEPGEIPY